VQEVLSGIVSVLKLPFTGNLVDLKQFLGWKEGACIYCGGVQDADIDVTFLGAAARVPGVSSFANSVLESVEERGSPGDEFVIGKFLP